MSRTESRMKPKQSTKATKKQNSGSRPVCTICCWYHPDMTTPTWLAAPDNPATTGGPLSVPYPQYCPLALCYRKYAPRRLRGLGPTRSNDPGRRAYHEVRARPPAARHVTCLTWSPRSSQRGLFRDRTSENDDHAY